MTAEQLEKVAVVFKLLDEITDYLEYHDADGEDMKNLGSAWHHVSEVMERYRLAK